ncbi:MAG: hypothetical protein QXX12_03080 [Nanopusillaceae archaeon]
MVREELELEALRAFIAYRRKRKQYFDEYSKVASDLVIARKNNILVVHDREDYFDSYVYIVAAKTPEKAARLANFIKKMREVFEVVNVSEILERAIGDHEYEFQDDENEYVFYYE